MMLPSIGRHTLALSLCTLAALPACLDENSPTSPSSQAPTRPSFAVDAATTAMVAEGVTGVAGQVHIGEELWVSDHLMGFCPVDPATQALDTERCSTAAVSPGQPSYSAATGHVYIPDNSSKSQGVWRLSYDPNTSTVGNATLLTPSHPDFSGLTRSSATALGPDGNLYVAFTRNGKIVRILNPSGGVSIGSLLPSLLGSGQIETVGSTFTGGGVNSMTFLGPDLYLAEEGGITKVQNAANCSSAGSCTAELSGIGILAPSALASSGDNVLYSAEGGYVYRTSFEGCAVGKTDLYAGGFDKFILGLSVAESSEGQLPVVGGLGLLQPAAPGALYVSDDPSGGEVEMQGQVWRVNAGAAPVEEGACGEPAPAPSSSAPYTGTLFAEEVTGPAGQAGMGTEIWVSDHMMGFCPVNPATRTLDAERCSTDAVSAGQPSYSAATGHVYIPDNSSKSQGVWRLSYEPNTGTLGNATLLSAAHPAFTDTTRSSATALGPDGNLYVGFKRNGRIMRLVDPSGANPSIQSVGMNSSGEGVVAMAFVGADLYLAGEGGIAKIQNAQACTACTAQPVTSSAVAPTALASDGTRMLYIAETPGSYTDVLRLDVATGMEAPYAGAGIEGDGSETRFRMVSGLYVGADGSLYVGDDPTGGEEMFQGHVWRVPPTGSN